MKRASCEALFFFLSVDESHMKMFREYAHFPIEDLGGI